MRRSNWNVKTVKPQLDTKTMIIFILLGIMAGLVVTMYVLTKQLLKEPISPIQEITKPITKTVTNEPIGRIYGRWVGTASYYSRSGCIGCHPQMIMANGQPLDDTKLTVAFNKLPLNSRVLVTNISTGQEIEAQVTDTGGFEALDRIIDLSVATKEAIGCSDLCEVQVKEL